MLIALIQNAALLITLSVFYGIFIRFRDKKSLFFKVLTGAWFGLVAIAGMMMPFVYEQGIIFDGRSVVLTLAGLFGGVIPAFTAMILSGLFRVFIGGVGVYAGIATIVFCALIGLFFRRQFSDQPEKIALPMIFLIGLIAHIVMLACQLFYPWPAGLTIIQRLWLPVLLIFPLAFTLISVLLNLTEKRFQSEQMVMEAEYRYRSLYNSIRDSILVADTERNIIDCNHAFSENFGYRLEELKGMKTQAIYENEEQYIELGRALEEHFGNSSFRKTVNYIRKNGSVFPGETGVYYQKGKDGRVTGFIDLIRDVSEREKAERALRESDRIFNYTLDMLCITGFDGYFKVLNPSWSRILGYTTEELLAKPWIEFVHPEDKQKTTHSERSLIDGREVYLFENRYICKDGSVKWLAWNSYPYPEENIMFGVARDITESKQAEQKLQESEEKFRELITRMEQGLAVHEAIYDEDGRMIDYRFIELNESFEKLTGLKRTEILGKKVLEVLPGLESYWISEYEKVVKTGKPLLYENYSKSLNKHYEVVAYRNREHQFAVILTDTTESKKVVNELRELKDELELKVKEKTSELQERIVELERFKKATVDREIRMKELRDEIAKLRKESS